MFKNDTYYFKVDTMPYVKLLRSDDGQKWVRPHEYLFELGADGVTVGRRSDSTIPIPDDECVSRRHGRFYVEQGVPTRKKPGWRLWQYVPGFGKFESGSPSVHYINTGKRGSGYHGADGKRIKNLEPEDDTVMETGQFIVIRGNRFYRLQLTDGPPEEQAPRPVQAEPAPQASPGDEDLDPDTIRALEEFKPPNADKK
jgi:hypothetical protein